MRKWIDLVEARRASKTLDDYPRASLPKGTMLYHGTNTAGDFEIPDGPAWFAPTFELSRQWVGWASPPSNRALGDGRIHEFEVIADIPDLIDIRVIPHDMGQGWSEFCEAATGEYDELGPGWVASALVGKCQGWQGREEIMLTEPQSYLRFVDRTPEGGDA